MEPYELLIILTKEECHQSLPDFYDVIANKLGVSLDNGTRFDCRYICVTEAVHKEIDAKMQEEGLDKYDRASLWLSYGPKANIHVISNKPFFAAKVESGFIIFEENNYGRRKNV